MGKFSYLRWFHVGVLGLLLVTVIIPSQFAVSSLVIAFGLTTAVEFFASRASFGKQVWPYRFGHFILFSLQFASLIFFIVTDKKQPVIWLNMGVPIVVCVLLFFQLRLSIHTLLASSFVVHSGVFLLGAFLLFQAELNRKEQADLTQLNVELVSYHDYWKNKVDSISNSIQMRNPDPVLSIWTDLRRGQELTNQLAYSRKIITERVTHDFFTEPDQLLKNQEWVLHTSAISNWWLGNVETANNDYQFNGLKKSLEDVITYQRYRLESLNEWLENTESKQWFNSLEQRTVVISAIETTQGLLYLMGTINEMLAHKLTYFELEHFDESFASNKDELASSWQTFQQRNKLKNPISIECELIIFALLLLAVMLSRYSLKIIGASFFIFCAWLVHSGVNILSVIWLPLIVFGVTSFLLDIKQVSSHESISSF